MTLFKTGKALTRLIVAALMMLSLVLVACGDPTATTSAPAATTAPSGTTAPAASGTTAGSAATTAPAGTTAMAAMTTAPAGTTAMAAMTTAPAGTTAMAAMTPGTTTGAMSGTPSATTSGSGSMSASTVDFTKATANVTGSGSSLVNPVMQEWLKGFGAKATSAKVNYNSVGSGQGRQDIYGGKSDFAGTDTFAPASEADGANYTYFPVTLAGVVLAYNLDGVTDLKLDPATIGGIYTGKITKWNDPAIKAINSGATLPDLAITLAVRQDSSGTSSVFSNYVAAVSPDFKAFGIAGSQPTWSKAGLSPVQAPQNDGVAGLVKGTKGTLGYIEVAYAIANSIPYASVKNAAGNFVKPTLENISAAAASATVPDTLQINLLNQPGANAYPISTTTYIMVPKDFKDATKAYTVLALISYAVHEGQAVGPGKNYAPLPASLVEKIDAKLKTVTAGGQPVLK